MAQNDGKSIQLATSKGGVEVLTIANDVAQGADQPCRRAWIYSPTGNNDAYYNHGATADADDYLLLEGVEIELPISNTNQINIYGTDGDKIYVRWYG
ncbi:MAG: hypothetical protein PHI12_12530 [Dehalococcoidales bacterium]|nr:hypothetical protein [Dehalococcoidales bacterium]